LLAERTSAAQIRRPGMGDVKMLALIGAFLGWKLVLLPLALASILGSVVGLG